MNVSELPKFVLLHLCSFFDLRSFATFSLTSKKSYHNFSHIRNLFKIMKQYHPKLADITISQILKQTQNEFNSILHLACQNKYISIELIKYLVENKSDLNSLNGSKATPLHFCTQNENVSIEIFC